jgi:hypothetical protein
MNNRDEDLTVENVDERIEHIRRSPDNQMARGRVLRELQSVYELSPTPLERTVHDLERVYAEDQRLERLWERINQRATTQERPYASTQEEHYQPPSFQGEQKTMYNTSSNSPGSFQPTPGGASQPPRPPRRRKFGLALGLAAAIILVGVFAWTLTTLARGRETQTASGTPTVAATPATAMPTLNPTTVPFTVTSVDMAVSPTSLNGDACGTTLTVTYTATFHFPAGNAGGTVAFDYTMNNGRSQTAAQLSVQPGQTSAAYKFTWSGTLPADHTMPEAGGVMVVSPNTLTSSLLGPSGACSSPSAAFSVTSVGVTASPALTGHACGTAFTETYTATFHIAANGPGGTIVFTYTTNNGRGTSQNIDLHVAAGQTTATYTFTWSGTLEPGSPDPGNGIVQVTAPNQVLSSDGVPSGHCS